MTLIVIASLLTVFFVLAFLSKRRFGTLGLALAAGALLANQLTVWLAGNLTNFDVYTGVLPEKVAANIALTLLPALALLISGPAYVKRKQAAVGAAAFAAMATMLILAPLASVLPSDENNRTILSFIANYNDVILTALIVFAIVDAWLTHNVTSHKKKHAA